MKSPPPPMRPGLAIRPNLLRWLPKTPSHAFDVTDRSRCADWQRKARKQFFACLGPFPQRVALRPKVLERKKLDGYTRTMLTINTAPGVEALCWLCVPDKPLEGSKPGPAMIATPGHGIGARDLLAMDAKGAARPEGQGYQKDYALQAVRLGYITLVVEPMGFGERRDHLTMTGKSGEAGCHAGFALATMLGTSLAAIRINDLCRALDHLQEVKGVDPERIGLMGISGGGQLTLWTSAVEPRFKAAIVSGYLNRVRDSIMGMHHCICNFIPGMANHFDMPDLAAMIAPRPLLIESGTLDPIFPIKATRAAVKTVRASYKVFGAEDRVEVDIFEGDHQWSGRKLEKFLAASL
ncbi:MAG: prolyl oligopeptidase family serine peptidase [Planctomycetota bacterium]|nr:prolyl oligopeptidase family serine peptidase [Planctomycetota bacterium]